MSKKATGKIGVLLVNLGTPDTPNTPDVRKYLREFLLDKRVIDINPVGRYALINGVIAPFRAPKSAKVYKQLWTDRGSPLLYHGLDLQKKLQDAATAALRDPALVARLKELGMEPAAGTPDDFRKLIATALERNRRIVQTANISAE